MKIKQDSTNQSTFSIQPNRKSTSFEVLCVFKWWWEMDSNHRRQCQQIYSLPPLATRESHRNGAGKGGRTPLTSLEGWCTADMPDPHRRLSKFPRCHLKMVPTKGVEPLSLAAHGPEPCASANSATSAGTFELPGTFITFTVLII